MSRFPKSILAQAEKVQLLVLDVDGVLTDGKLYFGQQGDAMKAFHVHDGLGIKWLKQCGIETAIITAKQSGMVEHRAHGIGIEHIYQNQSNKMVALEDLLNKLSCPANQACYVGDDLPDAAAIQHVGLGIAVPNATDAVKNIADWVSHTPGGQGAVREICELILTAKGKLTSLQQGFLNHNHV